MQVPLAAFATKLQLQLAPWNNPIISLPYAKYLAAILLPQQPFWHPLIWLIHLFPHLFLANLAFVKLRQSIKLNKGHQLASAS
jgi:hypothetical protein